MTEQPVLFIVDDDAYFNQLLNAIVERIAERQGWAPSLHAFQDGLKCLDNLHLKPDVILLDFYLDTRNDITATAYDLLSEIHAKSPETKILIISQQEDWSLFRDDLITAGASDFLHKSRELEDRLEDVLVRMLQPKS